MKTVANKLLLKSIMFTYMLFALSSSNVCSQTKLSKYEQQWVLLHPSAAIKIKKHIKESREMYLQVKASEQLDTFDVGGKLDAFRHVYTMAYLTKYVKPHKLRQLGIAHEKGNKLGFYTNKLEFNERADSLGCQMDLINNELGFKIGQLYKKKNSDDLKNRVIAEINTGNAWHLKRNQQGNYLNCDNEVIDMKSFKKQWFVPKCLIKTNE